MKSYAVLIANPASYSATPGKTAKAAALLEEKGYDVKTLITSKRGDAEEFAKGAAAENPAMIIAAGGDGTFNEVINGAAFTNVPIAIIPFGTTNVLAKELGIPEDVKGAADAALRGSAHAVSLGKITFGDGLSRYFCLMAGIGYDAETVYNLSGRIKRISGKGAHIISGIETLISWNPEPLSFSVDGKICEGYSAIICKTKKYAGDFVFSPDASIEEPSLYAFIMHGKKRLDILRYVSAILLGRHLSLKDVTYVRASTVDITGAGRIQLDGDYSGTAPASVTAIPDAARLIY